MRRGGERQNGVNLTGLTPSRQENLRMGCNTEMYPNHFRDVEILKKSASPGFSIWDCSKGTTDINVPMHYLLAYLDDIDTTSEYDDMFLTGMK